MDTSSCQIARGQTEKSTIPLHVVEAVFARFQTLEKTRKDDAIIRLSRKFVKEQPALPGFGFNELPTTAAARAHMLYGLIIWSIFKEFNGGEVRALSHSDLREAATRIKAPEIGGPPVKPTLRERQAPILTFLSNLLREDVSTKTLTPQESEQLIAFSSIVTDAFDVATAEAGQEYQTMPRAHSRERIGRNSPCPCGNGRKFKKCHGAGSPV